MRNKSERYIAKQKQIYAELINAEEDKGNKRSSMLSAFYLANKKGDLDIYRDLIIEIEAEEEFEDQAWDGLNNDPKVKEALVDFSKDIGAEGIRRRFGYELGDKVEQLYESGRLNYADVHHLLDVHGDAEQGQIVSELLDVFTNPNIKAGIHMTGSREFTESILSEGLRFTGHSGWGSGNKIESLESMTQNIMDVQNPGLAVLAVSNARYKSQMSYYDDVDVIVVAIPKEDINFRADIIEDNGKGQNVLNPRYIYGAVTTDKEQGLMLEMTRNERFLDYDAPSVGQKNDNSDQGTARGLDYDMEIG